MTPVAANMTGLPLALADAERVLPPAAVASFHVVAAMPFAPVIAGCEPTTPSPLGVKATDTPASGGGLSNSLGSKCVAVTRTVGLTGS